MVRLVMVPPLGEAKSLSSTTLSSSGGGPPTGLCPPRPPSRRCRAVADPLPERARLTAGPLMAHHPALISTTAAIENLDVVGLLNERHESAGLSRLKAL